MQAQGVFQFFNKPGQKGQGQAQRGQGQGPSSTAREAEVRAVNADWGDQQVRLHMLQLAAAAVVYLQNFRQVLLRMQNHW